MVMSKTKILERTRAVVWFEPVWSSLWHPKSVQSASWGSVSNIDVETQFLRFHVVWELPSQFLTSPKPNHKQLGIQCYKHSNEVIPFGEACAKSPIKQKDLNSNYHPEISISPIYIYVILSKKYNRPTCQRLRGESALKEVNCVAAVWPLEASNHLAVVVCCVQVHRKFWKPQDKQPQQLAALAPTEITTSPRWHVQTPSFGTRTWHRKRSRPCGSRKEASKLDLCTTPSTIVSSICTLLHMLHLRFPSQGASLHQSKRKQGQNVNIRQTVSSWQNAANQVKWQNHWISEWQGLSSPLLRNPPPKNQEGTTNSTT